MKFRMVDRITAWQSRQSISGLKTTSLEEYHLRTPLGEGPALPESLLMECLFQLGNWLIVLSSDFTQMGLLVRLEEVEFHNPLGPGQVLQMDAQVVSYRPDGIVFDGTGTAAGRPIITGRGCLATPVDLSQFQDAADLRVLFSEIYRPEKG
jgi:3-hydroxymyristoyl/3-hydroxydecanoyl-(acyl carrier protein) dehydratase